MEKELAKFKFQDYRFIEDYAKYGGQSWATNICEDNIFQKQAEINGVIKFLDEYEM